MAVFLNDIFRTDSAIWAKNDKNDPYVIFYLDGFLCPYIVWLVTKAMLVSK